MGNDSKYGRLYPERAVAPLRQLAQEAVETYRACVGTPTAAALRWEEALNDLDRLGFPPDEPLFLLRGQDVLAPETVEFYAATVHERGVPLDVGHVLDHAKAMQAWQPRKLPD